jgi:mono/diheme cytochrome c family protein
MAGLMLLAACGGDSAQSNSDSPEKQIAAMGKRVYNQQCITCHQSDGKGVPNVYPTLHGTEWVVGDKGRLVRLLLDGMKGPITVKGNDYNAVMTAHGPVLNDKQIAAVLTYVRKNFGNNASKVTTDEVTAVRMADEHDGAWQASELRSATGIPTPE